MGAVVVVGVAVVEVVAGAVVTGVDGPDVVGVDDGAVDVERCEVVVVGAAGARSPDRPPVVVVLEPGCVVVVDESLPPAAVVVVDIAGSLANGISWLRTVVGVGRVPPGRVVTTSGTGVSLSTDWT